MRTLPYLAALGIVVASGIFHGLQGGDRGTSAEMAARVAELARVPATIGDWEGQDATLDPRVTEMAEIAGYLMRRYVNRLDGSAVSVLIVCGPPGPISVHTPEVCYGGNGFVASEDRSRHRLAEGPSGEADTFWLTNLVKADPVLTRYLRIFYAWNARGTWEASGQPRLEFASAPALYKMYLVRDAISPGESIQDDPTVAFAREFLPALRSALFATTGGPTTDARPARTSDADPRTPTR